MTPVMCTWLPLRASPSYSEANSGASTLLSWRASATPAAQISGMKLSIAISSSWLAAELLQLPGFLGRDDLRRAHALEVVAGELLRAGRPVAGASVSGALPPLCRCGRQVGLGLDQLLDRVGDLVGVYLAAIADIELVEVEELVRIRGVGELPRRRSLDLGAE